MKILVYGAGPLGSLFASRLMEGGHEVSLLARGQRLSDLRQHGLVLVDTQTGQETVLRPRIVEQLAPGDAYDLVLVILRKNAVPGILPILAANHHTPNVLFLQNNAAGPGELIAALGAGRVLLGFPMAGGYRRGHVIHYLAGGTPEHPVKVPIGETNGQITPRLQQVGQILSSMPGFEAELRPDMDAWLKTHVALLMPSLAPAMAGANLDNLRMAKTRDLVTLTVRAIREGFRVLHALNVSITPFGFRLLSWIPEPVLVVFLQRRLVNPHVRVALFEHADAAQDELQYLADEFLRLARTTTVPTPAINQLYAYFDSSTPRMPEGQADIPLDWRGVWIGLGALVGFSGSAWWLFKFLRRRSTL